MKGLRGRGLVAVSSIGIVKDWLIHRIITVHAAHRVTLSRQVHALGRRTPGFRAFSALS
jgi:hypothetical protein